MDCDCRGSVILSLVVAMRLLHIVQLAPIYGRMLWSVVVHEMPLTTHDINVHVFRSVHVFYGDDSESSSEAIKSCRT